MFYKEVSIGYINFPNVIGPNGSNSDVESHFARFVVITILTETVFEKFHDKLKISSSRWH